MKNGYRHELKYLISRASAELLRRRLPHFMGRDPHAGPTGKYTIRSLYFDDFYGSAMEEKESGLAMRTKYRLRCYNYDLSFVKLERKEKHDSLTKKAAQTLSRQEALALQALEADPGATGLKLELQNKLRWEALRPRVLVDYDRYVFAHPVGNTRVTLDMGVRTSPCKTELFDRELAMLPVLAKGEAVLEVKYDDAFPRHVGRLLEGVARDRMAVSKYCRCLAVLE